MCDANVIRDEVIDAGSKLISHNDEFKTIPRYFDETENFCFHLFNYCSIFRSC